VTGYCMVLRGK